MNKSLSLGQATLLLFLKRNRGPQTVKGVALRSANSLVMHGFADKVENNQFEINWAGLDFAYRNL